MSIGSQGRGCGLLTPLRLPHPLYGPASNRFTLGRYIFWHDVKSLHGLTSGNANKQRSYFLPHPWQKNGFTLLQQKIITHVLNRCVNSTIFYFNSIVWYKVNVSEVTWINWPIRNSFGSCWVAGKMLVFSFAGAPLSVSQDATRAVNLLYCRSPRWLGFQNCCIISFLFKAQASICAAVWQAENVW